MLYNILSLPLKKRTFINSQLSLPIKTAFFLSIILLTLFCQAYRLEAQTITEPKQLTGHENHKVTLSYAASLTRNFRVMTNATSTTVLGEFFGKDALVAALNQDNCIGLRIYYGMKNDGTPALVLVGVEQSGSDMTNGLVLENGFPCPPICDVGKHLIDDFSTTSALFELKLSGPKK